MVISNPWSDFLWCDTKLLKRLFTAFILTCMFSLMYFTWFWGTTPNLCVSLSQRSVSELNGDSQPLCVSSHLEKEALDFRCSFESVFPFWFLIDVFCGYFLFRRMFKREQWCHVGYFQLLFFSMIFFWIVHKFKMISLSP